MESSKLMQVAEKLRQNPEDPQLWLEKGLAYVDLGMYYEAIEAYSIGLSFDPKSDRLFLERGRRYISTHRYREAVADTVVASSMNPDNFDNWYYQAVAYCLLEDYAHAAPAMENALNYILDKDPSLVPPVVDWLWVINMRLGRKDAAQDVLKYVDEDTPAYAMAPTYKKVAMLYKGKLSPEGFVDESLLTSEDPRAMMYYITELYYLSNYYYHNNNTEQANECLRKLKKVDRDRYVFAYQLAELDMKKRGI